MRLYLIIGVLYATALGVAGGLAAADFWPARPQEGWATDCRVVEVTDGDTLTVEVTRRLRVRLLDCWAPELRAPKGPASKAALEKLCLGRRATLLVPAARGGEAWRVWTFGRVLGHVWAEGSEKSLSQLQAESGHAAREKE